MATIDLEKRRGTWGLYRKPINWLLVSLIIFAPGYLTWTINFGYRLAEAFDNTVLSLLR